MENPSSAGSPPPQRAHVPCPSKTYGSAQLSFDAVYAVSRGALFSRALYLLRKRDAAEEIVQEVFLYAWTHADRFDERRGSLLTWLLMLCQSRAIDHLRGQTAGNWLSFQADDDAAAGHHEATPETLYETEVRSRAITSAIELLTVAQREVIVLNFYRELSHCEIADDLDLPLGSVKTLIRRARLSLAGNASLSRL